MKPNVPIIAAVTSLTGWVTTGVALAAYARYIEPRRPRLEKLELPVPAGVEYLHGLRIGFVSDFHHGPFTSLESIERGLLLLSVEQPDLLLLGGDYLSESPRYEKGIAQLLGQYARHYRYGAVGVMGNHDYAVSGSRTARALEDAGVRMLKNEAAEIKVNGGSLWIAGIDDTLLGEPDAVAAFAAIPEGEPSLALWHEPFQAEQAAALGAFAQLSGHTHGGQVRLPLIGALSLPKHGHRYQIGLDRANGMHVYTSRGLGMYRPPVRFNCPPEVTRITLVAR